MAKEIDPLVVEALAASPYEASLALQEAGLEDAFSSLTERQQLIYRFRMRGVSQVAIANAAGISQPTISRELSIIKEHFRANGSEIDQDVTIGESACLFDEVEAKAWNIYHDADAPGDKLKGLATVMAAREKKLKLLMDVGRLERAGTKSVVEHITSPLVANWGTEQKELVANTIVQSTFSQVQAPLPPDDEEIQDAEFTHDED
jgi:hypothetical protein